MSDRLIYLPLGGAGEIGMNAYVYGYGPKGKERLILVDLGVTFPDMDTSPGVDLILPDISWLADNVHRLEAVFITHAHEDHVGAIGRLWHRLGVPVHARPFTAAFARLKLEEAGAAADAVVDAAPWPQRVSAGPFEVGFLPVSHSIPESSALVIDTPAGRLLHTADFKLDEAPRVGEPFDPALWKNVAADGLQALVCDSTNVFTLHAGRSESVLPEEISRLVARWDGMVVATTFASNVARLKTLAEAGQAAGRSICLLGRAMRRMVDIAGKTGVLTGFPPTISPEDASSVPREHLMLIVTGSQGERRAASAQLSRGKHMGLQMAPGDLFLFSSKTIPGNERDVLRIINAFSEMGVEVIDDSRGDLYHVSGHANRPDLERVHEMLAPRMLVPMHGEHRHLREHARLAGERGIPAAVAPNGTMLDLTGSKPEIAEHVETGRTYLDGGVLVGALDGVVRDRIRVALNGHVTATLIIDEDEEPLGDPWCDLTGLAETGRSGTALVDVLEADLSQLVKSSSARELRDDDKLEEAIRRRTRQTVQNELGKKPEVTVVISRLS